MTDDLETLVAVRIDWELTPSGKEEPHLDGYSLHLTKVDMHAFIRRYNDTTSDLDQDGFSYAQGKGYKVPVDKETLRQIMMSDCGIRKWDTMTDGKDLTNLTVEESDQGYELREIVLSDCVDALFIVHPSYLKPVKPEDLLPGDVVRYTYANGRWAYCHLDEVHIHGEGWVPSFDLCGTYYKTLYWGLNECRINDIGDGEIPKLERVAPCIAEKLIEHYKKGKPRKI